ncbi:hypothetical protein NIES4101_59250 [Calothrix sp. NIES-4101]|nr:hypothetical protein NIES4101_59250 [Calothrix sp. NIES-4101]
MIFEYRLNVKDFQEMNKAHPKKILKIYFLGIAVFLIFMSLLPLIQSGKITLQDIITDVILPNLILFICFYLGMKIIPPLILKYSWKNHPASQRDIHVEVVEEGLIISTSVEESNLKWAIFESWLETPNLFLVYQTKNCCNIFPKRAFMSEADINQFRDILRERVSQTQRN